MSGIQHLSYQYFRPKILRSCLWRRRRLHHSWFAWRFLSLFFLIRQFKACILYVDSKNLAVVVQICAYVYVQIHSGVYCQIYFGSYPFLPFVSVHSLYFLLYSCGQYDLYACFPSLSLFPTLCLYKKIIYANGSFTTKNRAEHQKSLVKNNVKKQCSQPQTHARTHARAHPMGSYTNEYFDWSFQFLCSRSYHQ